MEQSNTTTPNEMNPVVPETDFSLPNIISLYKNALAFVKARLDLLAIISIPLLIISVTTVGPEVEGFEVPDSYLATYLVENGLGGLALLGGLVTLVAVVVHLINMAVMLHAVHQPAAARVPYGESFKWAKSNFWSYIWIAFLAGLITTVGYILLIIPGIIASGFLAFSLFVFFNENKRGTDALKRSYQLVKRRWFKVVLKYVGVLILILITAAAAGIIASIIGGIIGGTESVTNIITELLGQFIAVGVSLMGMHVGKDLYLALAASRPEAAPAATPEMPS